MSADTTTKPLVDDQRLAVVPDAHVWLSASAGTGKTQVLSARVLRLLLQPDVEPGSILCLTFTKAGASEMANRINAKLASWVRLDDTKLGLELGSIGAPIDPATLTRARQLFAKVLDAPQGGLRILTIHSFCQTLLAAFPEEAGVAPGFEPIEDRDRRLLARDVLGTMLEAAARRGDMRLQANLEEISLDLGPEGAETFLMRCGGALDALAALVGDMRPWVNRAVGLQADVDEDTLALLCDDAVFDRSIAEAVRDSNVAWGTKTGLEKAGYINQWLDLSPVDRLAQIDLIWKSVATAANKPQSWKSFSQKVDPNYEERAGALFDALVLIRERKALVRFAGRLARALEVGRAFAFDFADAKRRTGVLDFDDQIRITARLLTTAGMADWIRYKLDQRLDHILVDEAQDTNAQQWDIVWSLVADFFAGEGSKPDRARTLFTVGDFKQAIFGFQGTSPYEYLGARGRIQSAARSAGFALDLLTLNRSFRSTQPVLDVVDAVFARIGGEALGLSVGDLTAHRGRVGAGQVSLWPPVSAVMADEADEAADDDGPASEPDEEGADAWLSREDRRFAGQLADQIKAWLTPGSPDRIWLQRQGGQSGWAKPGDIMILLRSRADLMRLIVARLYVAGVPVAGIDRLRLGQPLAVQDLIAAVRFALQPLDDLNLACLLVSPLVGWTQDELLAFGYRDKGVHLWPHLRAKALEDPGLAERLAPLRIILAMADYGTPYAFLEQLLSGPVQGRARLVARLGAEALDPISELLIAAHQFEANHDGGLQAFLHWFDSGTEEIKRELADQQGVVRVMTVHGSKGLQSPIVVLADSCSDPARKLARGFTIGVAPGLTDTEVQLPVFQVRKEDRVGSVDEAYQAALARDMEEHWRLLYVAMTRAEERLFIGGTLGRSAKQPPELSWYTKIAEGLSALDSYSVQSTFGPALCFGDVPLPPPQSVDERPTDTSKPAPEPLPDWCRTVPASEPAPPRPLAPSAKPEDDSTNPPLLSAAMQAAAVRGRVLHSLFERLPDIATEQRRQVAGNWLEHQAGIGDEADRNALIDAVLKVLEDLRWTALFGPQSLAEAPVAAVVGGSVVTGTIDRLLIEPERITIVDFKTMRRPPQSIETIPVAHIRQMAAYAAALQVIYPDREVAAALLYTAEPLMFVLPPALLAQHRPGVAVIPEKLD